MFLKGQWAQLRELNELPKAQPDPVLRELSGKIWDRSAVANDLIPVCQF